MPASGSLMLRLRHRAEALAVRSIFLAVRALPLDMASAVGGWLGRTIGPRLRRTDVARRNLRSAFPDKSDAEIEAIVRGMCDNLGRVACEYPHLDRFRFFNCDGRIEIVGIEHFDAMRDDGKPGIMFSGHLANWELLGPAAAARGAPLNFVYRAPNNPRLQWLFDWRRLDGAKMLPKGADGAKQALKLLKNGAHFAMLVDQKMNDGVPVPFFGRDAMTAPALALFALRFGCPVLPSRVERLGGTRFRITVSPPMDFAWTGDRRADVLAAMTKVNALLEQWIRERPEQWLWLHRRWPNSE
ncbi:MAG: lipid A biosynthesis lauroyl acyltransferase [Rhodoplanes sp.]